MTENSVLDTPVQFFPYLMKKSVSRLLRKSKKKTFRYVKQRIIARLIGNGEIERAKRVPLPRSYKVVAKELKKQLDAPVRVKTKGGKNKIEIEFKDEDDLQRIYDSC